MINKKMKCIRCNSSNVSWWSSSEVYYCKDCKKRFTEKSNPYIGVISDGNKYCNCCGMFKPLDKFFKNIDKPRSRCKECTVNNSRYNSKGITKQIFESMLESQKYKCKICNKELSSYRNSFIDHCHVTRKIRGVLCPSCNTFLGLCNEDIGILKTAIEYLSNVNDD